MRHPRRYVSPTTGKVSWRVRYRSPEGAEKSETFYDAAAAEEFARLLHALGPARALAYIDKRAREQGGAEAHALTVDELFTKWFEWKSAKKRDGTYQRVRSGRTLMDYERQYRRRIKPRFGDQPANLVAQSEVQQWVDALGSEVEPKTIHDYHSLLRGMFLWGLHPTRSLVIHDPCGETDLPKRVKKPPTGLRPAEWDILHTAAKKVDPDAADLLLFLVSTGWRWSEAVAVQALAVDHWTDDAGKSYTYISMGRVLRREGNHYAFVQDAKSEAGQRRVRIVGAGEEMVLRRLQGKKPEDLLLTTKRGARWSYTHFYRRTWKRPKNDDAPGKLRILEEAAKLGLTRTNITPHALRHTHVGMLILAGEPLTAIQRRLGHAHISTTSDTYGRMVEDASEGGLEKVAAMLGGSSPPLELGS